MESGGARVATDKELSDFLKSVEPLRGNPEAPTGYERRDMTTFYNVSPTTRVVFRADFYNDFMEGTDAARVFQASVVVRGLSLLGEVFQSEFEKVRAVAGTIDQVVDAIVQLFEARRGAHVGDR